MFNISNKVLLIHCRKVYTMDLFLLPKDVRCRIVCILLGAVKVDKDAKEVRVVFTLNIQNHVNLDQTNPEGANHFAILSLPMR